MRSFSTLRFGVLLAALAAVGCGPAAEVVPPLHPVTGTVKLDGKPAAGISVIFMPSGQNKASAAYGITDASGNYTLLYRNNEPGAAAGDYFVIFSKMALADGSAIPEGKTAADVMAIEHIPSRYRSTDMPEFAAKVVGGDKPFDFELQSK